MGLSAINLGVRIRGSLGDIDPLNKVPFKRARSRVSLMILPKTVRATPLYGKLALGGVFFLCSATLKH